MNKSMSLRLRDVHLSVLGHQPGEFETDLGVVDGRRDESCAFMSVASLSVQFVTHDIHCTKETALPVLPPTLPREFSALDAAPAALLIAGPAVLVTRDRPCEAFDAASPATLPAFDAAFEAALAASVVDEALRVKMRTA